MIGSNYLLLLEPFQDTVFNRKPASATFSYSGGIHVSVHRRLSKRGEVTSGATRISSESKRPSPSAPFR